MAAPPSNPSQLFLLADHIKLSLLERQRALSLSLPSDSQDSETARSLDSLISGIDALNPAQASEHGAQLRRQYTELQRQFSGEEGDQAAASSPTVTSPNEPGLRADFTRAGYGATAATPKSVRFSDNADADPNRSQLLPYRDEPDPSEPPDHGKLDNQQIHAYHSQVLRDQDTQLDTLGQSIGRQRELTIQIGDELDEQATMLEDVDEGVMRHQGQLDRAKRRLGGVARRAKDNWSIVTIGFLIVILVLLIIILKT
ncbi:MAG: hypothetical protein M1828_004633 [Chrysothrix sp. TS-e1954]|nr:MAG: hypothetical protein M1828_004633 [Chrysothrix sp. TS-e1954]